MLTDLKRDSLGSKLYYTLMGYSDNNWPTLTEQEKLRYIYAAETIYWLGRSEHR